MTNTTTTYSPIGAHVIMPYQRRSGVNYSNTGIIKLVGAWDNSDKEFYREIISKNPAIVVIGRLTGQWDIEDGGIIHNAARRNDLREVEKIAAGFADYIASIVTPDMGRILWESGPNEPGVEYGEWLAAYWLSFGKRMREHGLKYLVGGWSYGSPPTLAYDKGKAISDVWQYAPPVFRMIDQHNRAAGYEVAGFYLHEGVVTTYEADKGHICLRFWDAYRRFVNPDNLHVPMYVTEWAFPNGAITSGYNTEHMRDQLVAYLKAAIVHPDLRGLFRGATLFTVNDVVWGNFDWSPYFNAFLDACRDIKVTVLAPTSPTPQPEPAPVPEQYNAVVNSSDGLNLRRQPGLNYPKIAFMPNSFKVRVINEGGLNVIGTPSWVQVVYNGLTGWCAAWLLKKL